MWRWWGFSPLTRSPKVAKKKKRRRITQNETIVFVTDKVAKRDEHNYIKKRVLSFPRLERGHSSRSYCTTARIKLMPWNEKEKNVGSSECNQEYITLANSRATMNRWPALGGKNVAWKTFNRDNGAALFFFLFFLWLVSFPSLCIFRALLIWVCLGSPIAPDAGVSEGSLNVNKHTPGEAISLVACHEYWGPQRPAFVR